MTGLEFNNFMSLDKRKYILEENKEFLKWYSEMEKQGFKSFINICQMQDLINQITMFYEFKYPNVLFDSMRYNINLEACNKAKEISKMLDFEQLKFRLYHDYVQFLECSYQHHVTLNTPKIGWGNLDSMMVRISSNGEVDKYDLNCLKEYNFIDDIEEIERIEDLYGRFESIDTDVDYSELKRWIYLHKYYVSLRNRVLNLVKMNFLFKKNKSPKMEIYFFLFLFLFFFNISNINTDIKTIKNINI